MSKVLIVFFCVINIITFQILATDNSNAMENCNMNNMSSIKWMDSLEEAKKIAFKENKFLFICFCADWCESCHEMDKTTYKNQKVVDKLTNNFITVKLNISKSEEAEKIRKKYNIAQFPTMIFLDKEGNLLNNYTLLGFLDSEQFILSLDKVIKN